MKTAIITGASVGLGQELARQTAQVFPDVEQYWLIARREGKLKETAALLPGKQVRILSLDLCAVESLSQLDQALSTDRPDVALLVNNAGCGFLNPVGAGPLWEPLTMIDLNLRALTAVTHLVLPYMGPGSHILNISSIAAFCPNPRLTVYSAGKAYVSAFSRGLYEELRERNISVTAACPGPMHTEFITKGNIKGHSPMFEKLPYCDPVQVARGALRAAAKGKAVYTPKLFYKFYRVVAKVLPQALLIKFTRT